MATKITPASIAPVLRAAAGRVAELRHLRLIRTDVHHAILASAPAHDVAQAALDAFTAFLAERGDDRWLFRWASLRARDEVVAELRAAADGVERGEPR